MCRKKAAALLLIAGCWLSGCGDGAGSGSIPADLSVRGTVSIQKDGRIEETLKEEFDAAYYNEEELKNMILSAVAGFNSGAGLGDISVEEFEKEEGMISVRLNYPSDEAYTAFNTDEYNNCSLFCGTMEEARTAGYSLDVEWRDQEGDIAGQDVLDSMKEGWVVVTEQPLFITVPGKIRYFSEGVVWAGKSQAYIDAGTEEEGHPLHYIIFEK